MGGGFAHKIRGLPGRAAVPPSRRLWAPIIVERTSVGLDVHARSVAAAAIDSVTGELVQAKLPANPGGVLARSLPLVAGARWSWTLGSPAP